MKNNSNIYDIDGNIIRKAGDNDKMTVEEAQKRMDYYKSKLEELDEKDPKASTYMTYIRNLRDYIVKEYITMTPEQRSAEMERLSKQKSLNEQIQNAMEELKKEVEEEKERPETVMDEYVDFEEVKNEDNIQQSDPV